LEWEEKGRGGLFSLRQPFVQNKPRGKIMSLSKDLLEILACPKCVRDPGCTGALEYREAQNQLVCHHCKLIYRIEDDIPIMLIDEALPLENK